MTLQQTVWLCHGLFFLSFIFLRRSVENIDQYVGSLSSINNALTFSSMHYYVFRRKTAGFQSLSKFLQKFFLVHHYLCMNIALTQQQIPHNFSTRCCNKLAMQILVTSRQHPQLLRKTENITLQTCKCKSKNIYLQ